MHTRRMSFSLGIVTAILRVSVGPSIDAQMPEQAAISLAGNEASSSWPMLRVDVEPERDYRKFTNTRLREISPPEVFRFRFHDTAKITNIAASNDFHISGGSCIQAHAYSAKDSCTIEVVFTPQGPGRRTGMLMIDYSASSVPLLVPMGGEADGPVVAFIPAEITTLPGTYPAHTGLLLNPQGLAVDGGDNLYIADTGNDLIRFRDSGGRISILAGGGASTAYPVAPATNAKLAAPYAVVPDSMGNTYVADTGGSLVLDISPYQQVSLELGGGSSFIQECTPAFPCGPSVDLPAPYGLAIDASGELFVNVDSGYGGATPMEYDPANPKNNLINLESTLYSEISTSHPLAVDSADDLYYAYESEGNARDGDATACYIFGQNQAFNLGQPGARNWIVAGTFHCGFSGDGGSAEGAEISGSVQGFAFDLAGNFYFTDTGSNRVRRIDALTGIIHTVAGNGGVAYDGDGGAATHAAVSGPTGIAVDSLGRIYTTSRVGTSGEAVVRQIGPMGHLTFPPQVTSATSAPMAITVSNVGNDSLNISRMSITSGDVEDFAIDPNSTGCILNSPLLAGRSCVIGILFLPTAAGARAAVLTLLDDTVTGKNTIQLTGTGGTTATLTPSTITFKGATVGATSPAQLETLHNTGSSSLAIPKGGITITGKGATFFAGVSNCGATLAAGASCTVSITFTPKSLGTFSARLTVADDAVAEPQSAVLSGAAANPAKASVK